MIEAILQAEGDAFWSIAKLLVLFMLAIYSVFAFIIVRQVKLMNDTLEVGLEKQLRAVSLVHLGVSIFVTLLAIVIL